MKKIIAKLIMFFINDEIIESFKKSYINQSLYHYLVFGNSENLKIHETAVVNNALFNVVSGKITIGAYAFFGHDVSILTGTHNIKKTMKERQLAIPTEGRDIIIEEGVWIASKAVVLGPCRIGKNSVIGPSVIVTGNIEANSKITIDRKVYSIKSLSETEEKS